MSSIQTVAFVLRVIADALTGRPEVDCDFRPKGMSWPIFEAAMRAVGRKLNRAAGGGDRWYLNPIGKWTRRAARPECGSSQVLLHSVIYHKINENDPVKHLRGFLACEGEVCFSEVEDLVFASSRGPFLGFVMKGPVEAVFPVDVHSQHCRYTGVRYMPTSETGAHRVEAWLVPAKGELLMVITDHQEWRAAFEKAGYLVVGGSKESLSRGVTKDLCEEEEEDGEERLEESWRPQSWELQDRALMLRKRRQQAARERRAYLEAAWQKEEDAA